ncbi:MAG: glycosyltransferase family 4 protein [Pseudomonadota bacterium]
MTAKIIFLGPVPPPYMGPSVATQIILGSALKDKFRLIHLDTSDHRDLSTLGAVDFGNIYLALKHYCQLAWLILRHRPAIVYIPISQTTIGYLRDSVFIVLAKISGRKVVCHLRGGNFRNWYNGASAPTRWYVRTVHRFVDAQIVLGEKLKPLFQSLVPEDRIFVVPNGRDFETPPGSGTANRADRVTRVLYLSNFVRTKGVLDVMRSIPLVCRDRKDVEFIFAGDWNDDAVKREMEELILRYRDHRIRVVGKVSGSAKYDLLRQADMFVFPTYYPPEGHPWAIVEAMAAGLPVISTDQGAITESVIDGRNGFIVEKRDVEGIAGRILFLCNHADERKRMGEESRRLYEQEFTERRLVDRMADVFHSVLAGGRPGR